MSGLTSRRMRAEDRAAAAALFASLIRGEGIAEHAGAYGGAGDDGAIERALTLFLDRPELGFVWLVADGDEVLGATGVSLAVSTNLGAVVAKVPDFVVHPGSRGKGVGKFMMDSLARELRSIGVGRIDLGVHENNDRARRFYVTLGFVSNHESGMSLVL